MFFLTEAVVVDGGNITLPLWVASGVVGVLMTAIVALYKRNVNLTNRTEKRLDDLLSKQAQSLAERNHA